MRQDRLDTSYREDRLLDLLQCSQETPVAAVDPDEVETLAQRCRALWLEQNKIDQQDAVERICALYLEPANIDGGFQILLQTKL